MKKILLFAMVAMVTMLTMTGCKDHQTPEGDKTKLWPAYSPAAKKFGFIDAKGNFKIPATYDAASSFFSCGYAKVQVGDNRFFIDKKGNVKFTAPSKGGIAPFYYKYAVVADNGLYGLLDTKMNYAVMPQFAELGYVGDNGFAPFCRTNSKDSKWGYVDTKGKEVISAQYDWADEFYNGVAVVSTGSTCGIIDSKGGYKAQPVYVDIDRVGKNAFVARMDGEDHNYLMDATGKMLASGSVYTFHVSHDNGLIPAELESTEKWGYLNEKGETKIGFMYESATAFYQGYAWVRKSHNEQTGDYMYALIDTKGNEQFQMANATPFMFDGYHNGMILLGVRNKDGEVSFKWVDRKGNVVYQWSYSSGGAPERKLNDADYEEKADFSGENVIMLGF